MIRVVTFRTLAQDFVPKIPDPSGAVVKPGTMEMETETEMEMEMQVYNGSSLVPRPPLAFFEFMKWG